MDQISFADKIRQLTLEARSKKNENPNWKLDKTITDITQFFDESVKKDAMKKIESRAEKGCNSANILEYGYAEYFYVCKRTKKIVRVPKFEKIEGHFLHRIHDVVNGNHFKTLLKQYVDTLGDMKVACWYPGNNINVVEIYWGPTKFHKWGDESDNEDAADDDADEPADEEEPADEPADEEAAADEQ